MDHIAYVRVMSCRIPSGLCWSRGETRRQRKIKIKNQKEPLKNEKRKTKKTNVITYLGVMASVCSVVCTSCRVMETANMVVLFLCLHRARAGVACSTLVCVDRPGFLYINRNRTEDCIANTHLQLFF